MAQVRLPGNLVALFPGTPRRVEAEGATVREVLASLDARVPGMEDRLLTAGPQIRERPAMLLIIGIVLLVLWLLGFLAFHVTSFAIHILLLVGIVLLVMHLVSGRRTVV